jgi:hypothetical protein
MLGGFNKTIKRVIQMLSVPGTFQNFHLPSAMTPERSLNILGHFRIFQNVYLPLKKNSQKAYYPYPG